MNFNHDTGTIDTGLQTLDVSTTPPLGGTAGVLTIVGTGALTLPSGTTAQEPTGVAGMIRWNTSVPQLEYFNGTVWLSFTAGTGSVTSVTLDLTGTGLTTSGGASQTITTSGTFAIAGVLDVATGGTGDASLTAHNVLIGAGTSPVVFAAPGAQYQVLTSNGATSDPSFSSINLASSAAVGSSILPLANGGTNANNTAVAGAVAFSTASAINFTAAGTTNQILQSNGSGTPTWTSAPTVSGANITAATIPNSALANSTITIGTTTVSLGGTSTSLAGVTSITLTGGTSNITGVGTPVNASDAVNLSYLQNALAGLEWKQEAQAATTADLGSVTYNNGTSGVGATITNAGTQAAFAVDGYTASLNDRILVKNQASPTQNGIYYVSTVGSGSTNWVLTRVTDANTTSSLNNATLYVTNGTANGGSAWSQTTKNPVIGTDPVTFVQTAGTGGNAVTSFQTSLSGLTPSSATSGAVTLAGTLGVPSGGTGVTSLTSNGVLYGGATVGATAAGTTGQVLVGNTAAAPSFATLSGIAVTSITGTANEITASASTGAVTLSIPSTFIAPGSIEATTSVQIDGNTASSFVYSDASKKVVTTAAPTNGQLLIGSTGAVPVAAALTQGTGITITNGAGTITIANAGVTTFSAGTTGFTPSSATAGAITLAGVLVLANGGTNANLTASAGSVVYSTASAMAFSAVGTSGYFLTSAGAGAPTWSNPATTVVTSVSLNDNSTTSIYTTTPTAATTGAVAATITLKLQSANTVFAGPASGGATQPTFRTLVYNDLPIKLYVENPSTPTAPIASGTNAVAIGSNSSSTGTETFAVGNGTSATIFGSKAFANGEFATAGDAQRGMYVLRGSTTNATLTQLWLDGAAATQALVTPNNSVWTFDILVAARRTDATGGGAGYRFVGVVKKDTTAASITFVGTPSKSVLGETDVPWDAALTANTTTGDLRVSVTGQAGKTIRWVAVVETTEVTN